MSRHDPRAHDLTPELLLRAYAAGIFPMAESGDDPGVFWVDPQVRGVIPLNDFHVPRRLKKTVRGCAFEVRFDTAFTEVLELCAKSKRGRRETWINAPIKNAVEGLFELGFAPSVETCAKTRQDAPGHSRAAGSVRDHRPGRLPDRVGRATRESCRG